MARTTRLIRRIGKILGIAFGALILLVLLAAVGVTLYVRSEAGEQRLTRILNNIMVNALQATGMSASVGSVQGPLPFHINLMDLKLTDEDGTWFEANEVNIRISWRDLRQRRLDVTLFKVDKAHVARLPHLPQKEPVPGQPPNDPLAAVAKLSQWPDWLPPFTARDIQIQDITLSPSLLGEVVRLSLSGSASASSEAGTVDVVLTREDKPGGEQVQLSARLQPDSVLKLDLTIEENQDGLIARRVPKEIAASPRLQIHVQGEAPVQTWNGHFNLNLENAVKNETEPQVLGFGGQVGVNFQAWPLLAPMTLKLDAEAVTGPAATGLWQMVGQTGGLATAGLTLIATVTPSAPIVVNPASAVPVLTEDENSTAPAGPVGPLAASQPTEDITPKAAPPPHVDVTGTVHLQLASMRWINERLDKLLGESVLLKTEFHTQLGPNALEAAAEDAVIPTSATMPLSFETRNLSLTSQAVTGSGRVDLLLADLGAPLSSSTFAKSELALVFSDLSELGLADISSSQPLHAEVDINGPLSALDVSLLLDAQELILAGEELTNLRAALDVQDLNVPALAAMADQGALAGDSAMRGSLSVAAHARDQDAEFFTNWSIDLSSGQLRAALDGLLVNALGIRADGQVAFGVPLSVDAARATPAPMQEATLTGHIQAEVTDWTVVNTMTGLGLDGAGVQVELTVSQEASGPVLRADWKAAQLALPATQQAQTGVSVRDIQGSAVMRDIFNTRRLSVEQTTGLMQAGAVEAASTSVTAQGPLAGPLDVVARVRGNAAGDFSADAEATWRPGRLNIKSLSSRAFIDPETGALVPEKTPDAQPVGLTLAGPAQIDYGPGGFSTPGLVIHFTPSGSLGIQGTLSSQRLNLNAQLDDLSLALFRPFLPALPDGTARAVLTLTGTPARPQGELTLDLEQIKIPESPMNPVSARLTAQLQPVAGRSGGGELRVNFVIPPADQEALGLRGATASLHLPVTFQASGLPLLARRAPVTGTVRWDGDLAPLWSFVPLADRRLSGQALVNAELSGSLESPRLTGSIEVENGQYADLVLGLLLKDIHLSVVLAENIWTPDLTPPAGHMSAAPGTAGSRPVVPQVSATGAAPSSLSIIGANSARFTLTANDGANGTLAVEGTLNFANRQLDAHGQLDDLKPLRRQDLRISLSGDISASGPLTAPFVKADIVVNHGDLNLENLPGSSIRTLKVTDEKTGEPIEPEDSETVEANDASALGLPAEQEGTLDITVTVPNRFYIHGHGLDSEWRGIATISGTFSRPAVVGALHAVRGTLVFLNRTFTLSRGRVIMDGGQPINPRFDIVLNYRAPNILAEVVVTGTAKHPRFSLSSQPSVPQDEIISQVLFGRSAQNLSRSQALQLAAAAASLAGFGSDLGMFDFGKNFLGVDVFRINSAYTGDSNSSDNADMSGSTLEVGKYVSDRIYVGVEQGLGTDSTGVVVEIELTPRFQLESRTDEVKTEVGVQWGFDY